MEVHSHTHTERKKWTHYLWEFLMLFLAVFCGFLAENQREHMIEHKREKQYMKSLLEDLQNDIVDLKNDTAFWNMQFKRIDVIQKEIRKPLEKRNKLLLYRYSGYMRWYEGFTYHDRTIAQLKNGGNFRLIRNTAIADSLIEYDATVNTSLKGMEAISDDLWKDLNYLQNKLFNAEYYSTPLTYLDLDSAVKMNAQPIEIRKGTDDIVFEYTNQLDFFRGLNMVRNMTNEVLLHHANNLVVMLKKEYHLE
jgi:hypothetical protein